MRRFSTDMSETILLIRAVQYIHQSWTTPITNDWFSLTLEEHNKVGNLKVKFQDLNLKTRNFGWLEHKPCGHVTDTTLIQLMGIEPDISNKMY